ncbi:MAG: hypothetical protein K6F04_01965 [bacterium]|nr:hypothetical protein [bacterium]
MTNYLKKQNKLYITLSSILMCVFVFSEIANAQKGTKRSGISKSRRNSKSTSKVRSINKTTEQNTQTKESEKDISNITKYNCESLYNQCMNKKCYSDTNGRCACNNALKFEEADNECKYIYEACPLQSKSIIDTYKRNAKSDCSSFVISDLKNTKTALSNILAELTVCMQPKCRSKSREFLGCFDEDNFEKKLKTCEKVYSEASDVELLKSMFKDNMLVYKKKYCDEIYGTMKSDNECYLTIGIGPSFKTIKKTKEFKVGDSVICSENEFGTSLGESKFQKTRYVKDIVLTGVDILARGTSIAATVVGSKSETTSDKPEYVENGEFVKNPDGTKTFKGNGEYTAVYKGTGKTQSSMNAIDVMNLATDGLNGLVGSQHLGGAIEGVMMLKDGDFSYKGYCYVIKGSTVKELFEASDDYYYKLRWGEDWNSSMYSTESQK